MGGSMTKDLTGQVVLVTGASRGIGRAFARGFAADGANVVAFARSENDLLETTQGDTAHFLAIVGDVTAEADVDRLVAAAHHRFGRIDVLVNNAGLSNGSELLARPFFGDWAEVIRVNLLGLALCTHRVLPGMIERGYGRVINVVSRVAEFPFPRMSAYAASKAGVMSFTRARAAEVGPAQYPDILVNALIPGLTKTAMTRNNRDHAALQDPDVVYPHTRFLVTLPAGGPHGRVFWNSKEYKMYVQFNDPPQYRSVADLPRVPGD